MISHPFPIPRPPSTDEVGTRRILLGTTSVRCDRRYPFVDQQFYSLMLLDSFPSEERKSPLPPRKNDIIAAANLTSFETVCPIAFHCINPVPYQRLTTTTTTFLPYQYLSYLFLSIIKILDAGSGYHTTYYIRLTTNYYCLPLLPISLPLPLPPPSEPPTCLPPYLGILD